MVIELANDIGNTLLPWQQTVINDALTVDPKTGRWRKSNVGILAARQNGKTNLVRMRILAGLYVFGEESIIGMAQNRALALDTFKKTMEMAEATPWMSKRIKRLSRTNGQEEAEIYCHHWPKTCTSECKRIRKYSIRAATSEGPRGSTADLLFVDELREITPEAWAAASPLTRARPNSQTWVTSNAGDATSSVLNDFRARALQTDSERMGWYEWSAAPGSKTDDIKAWQAANPSLGHLIDIDTIKDASKFDNPDVFKTEALSMWVDAIDSPWDLAAWNLCESKVLLEDNLPTWMGLDLNFDRTRAYLISVQQRLDNSLAIFLHEWKGEPHIYEADLASELAVLSRRYRPRVMNYDPNTAGFVAPKLQMAGIPVVPVKWESAQFAIACDSTMSLMNSGSLVHAGQQTIYDHLVACAKRPASDGGWRIARRAAQTPIGAAVAMVMAIGEASKPQQSASIIAV